MALRLGDGVERLPGIGPARARSLEKLGLATVEDLLRYFPRDYEDRRRFSTVAAAPVDTPVCLELLVAEPPHLSRIRKGLELVKARLVDDTGSVAATFFNHSYMKDALRTGETYVVYGRVEGPPGRRQMTNPVCERADRARFTGRILPIYPLTRGISNNLLAGLTLRCVEECAGQMEETLPAGLRREHALAAAEFACRNIHFPRDEEALELARRRLIFEELFCLACGMALLRTRRTCAEGVPFSIPPVEEFLALLPFSLTAAQRRAMEEVATDAASGAPMNRLVQGDVGSGKTMVAAYGAWLAAKNGGQCALMAPTELLAEQHFRSLAPLLGRAGVRVGLLTGSVKGRARKELYAALAAGEVDLVVGTHALLSEGVAFSNLALAITDEQHRFGVAQRAALAAKAGRTPHVLVMSATPIPRTLALIIYGDLEVSVIDELPPGRTPVETYVVGEEKRQRMYRFVRKLVGQGRQAYIVCPAVEEGEESPGEPGGEGLKAAVPYAEHLKSEVFPDLRVGLVHGKMKARDKDAAMTAFAAGELDVLVSTTVIEVGVDVPNAALMVVENADRFGLSQLHQLRGRVGRGKHQSYCVLMTSTHSAESRERLRVLAKTADGFRIAEEDLKLRGPGDFFGQRQHGLPQLGIADLAADMRVLKEAQQAAQKLLEADPGLSRPEHAPLLGRVRRLFAQHGDMFN
ncbi:DNA helicase RecG [Flavonifractor plautii]|uniref:ATP-dependent DNA helicase RecG n=1 Tax=Flavonifractor plautii TaxID=292800 RepID=A0AAX1KLQ7_FLAPL|nr:ATP-dependent DNA helicase RecG [Flavonifractor plautii]ANU40475.1 DNA helicase RecG [Flavonifractor plautii]OXE44618.1 DNA helicase RecG [Flavonifractor plautii]QQR06752.1 ATP-dependent DNA helicase RecG [Flavonifractor plautii]UQA27519.1 ATP-dependent DNA helicase RecG [Flavonifractor plautii]